MLTKNVKFKLTDYKRPIYEDEEEELRERERKRKEEHLLNKRTTNMYRALPNEAVRKKAPLKIMTVITINNINNK